MAGPMVTCVSGYSSFTASASTWAASWRSSSRASPESRVTMATDASVSMVVARSRTTPSIRIASAALASPLPMLAATSAPVTGPSKDRIEPSGSVIRGMSFPSRG